MTDGLFFGSVVVDQMFKVEIVLEGEDNQRGAGIQKNLRTKIFDAMLQAEEGMGPGKTIHLSTARNYSIKFNSNGHLAACICTFGHRCP